MWPLQYCFAVNRVSSGLYRDMVVLWQVVKVAGVSLWALFREKKEKPRN